jgi:hypothetical protein
MSGFIMDGQFDKENKKRGKDTYEHELRFPQA